MKLPPKRLKLFDDGKTAVPMLEDAILTMARRGPSTDTQGSKIVSSTTPQSDHGDEKGWEEERTEEEDGESEGFDDRGGESDEEGDYDWEAEAQKPPEGKGFQSIGWKGKFKYRKMVWERRDGRWCGRWTWSAWKEKVWKKHIEDGRERAIRAWNAARAPQEVLLLVIQCLVGRPRPVTLEYSNDMLWEKGLQNLAPVCRAWRILIEPAMFSTLVVRDEVLGSPLRQSLAQHARRILVRSVRPIITSARLTQSARHPSPAVELDLEGPEHEEDREAAAYHPLHTVIYSQLHRSYHNVTTLGLWGCTFLSSSDLLRLLASFSALQQVDLSKVSVAHVSNPVIRRGRSFTSPVRDVAVDDSCTPPRLHFLTYCWTWPCKPSDQRAPPFHGLIPAEQQLAVRFVELLGRPGYGARYHLDAMDTDGTTWVAWVNMDPLHVEFHLRQHDSLHPSTAHVRHCLLRVDDSEEAQAVTQRLTTIGNTFTRFAYLESIVLETRLGYTTDELELLIESLRKVCTVQVQHRTCDDGRKLALQAKKSPSRSASEGLLSPFWCLGEHVWWWTFWLSYKYYTSLKAEDWKGWDPSHPPAALAAAIA